MRRKFWLSLAMLAAGAALLVATGFASPAGSGPNTSLSAQAKRGGTLRLARFADVDFVDPALAYDSYSWGSNSRPARSCSTTRTGGCGGDAGDPGGGRSSGSRATVGCTSSS